MGVVGIFCYMGECLWWDPMLFNTCIVFIPFGVITAIACISSELLSLGIKLEKGSLCLCVEVSLQKNKHDKSES